MAWAAWASELAERAREIAFAIAGLNAAAWAANVDPEATRPLVSAAVILDRDTTAALWRPADPSESEAGLLEAGEELHAALTVLGRDVNNLGMDAQAEHDAAVADRDSALNAVADGDEAAGARADAAQRRIADTEAALDILGPLAEAVSRATATLARLPEAIDLTYEPAHELARHSGMPRDGHFLTAAGAAADAP